ncbi:type II toxin-antitoxin system prevent-host-death family antitoxin [Streptomyces marincola]|uniref:type II toxin-antitoxin system prevent-host-death family antitoxin n=1 Tax=Streptomyces marincola TaxID=2878388 RepID=UPI001CF5129B|nr:type II toxin-antitoxin system prevent-host-death family antitoxin [Streptomyces marincola]UCM89398.1 type II toxin-antitoxin system prevent-host-death family antitoxin [Streptomyces marincola]
MVHDSELPDSVEETELPALLSALLERAARGGATVVTRDGTRIAAIMSIKDYEVAENAIDDALAARTYEDDGTRYSSDDVFGNFGNIAPQDGR